jgi:hypothetical protein
MKPKRKGGVPKGYKPRPDPTPKQIAAACLRIQATWTETERRKRCVYPEQPAETPIVAAKSLGA